MSIDINKIAWKAIPSGHKQFKTFEEDLAHFIKTRAHIPIMDAAQELYYLLNEWSQYEKYKVVITSNLNKLYLIETAVIDSLELPKKLQNDIDRQKHNHFIMIDKKYLTA